MPSRCCEFVDSRLRRSPPDRASAVPYGQAGENAMRFPHLAHRSAADHKLHSTRQQHEMNLISGNGETSSRLPAFSLLLPGTCPNNRDRRTCSLTRRPASALPERHETRTLWQLSLLIQQPQRSTYDHPSFSRNSGGNALTPVSRLAPHAV